MTGAHAARIGSRLRRIRRQQGLSLADVEERSGGVWKAVVVGAYERGDRAVTVSRLADLADFYGVPLADLLPDATSEPAPEIDRVIVLDLAALYTASAPGPLATVARFAEQIQRARGDHNNRVLSLRSPDVDTLALTVGMAPDDLLALLRERDVLVEKAD